MFDRRALLKLTGVAAFGGIGTASTARKSLAQSSGEVLFERDFTNVSVGDVPDEFTLAENSSQAVTDTTAAVDGRSYQMNGNYGGCTEAIARVPMNVSDEMTVTGHFRLGDGEIGCHEQKIGTIGLTTTTSSSSDDGSHIRFLNFAPNGIIKSQGKEIGTYGNNEWIEFEFEYVRDPENGTVTYNCKIDGAAVQTVTRDERSYEDDLSALQLNSGDFTVYWDDLRVIDGVKPDEPAVFDLSVDSVTPNSVAPGESATIQVTVTNTGGTADDQPIDINFDGERLARQEVALEPGDEATLEFTVPAPDSDGAYTYEIEGDQNSTTAPLEVESSSPDSTFDLSIEAVTPETVDPGSSAIVDVTVTNTMDTSETQSVDISLDDEQFDSRETTLDAGEATDLAFTVEVPETNGEYEIAVRSGENTVTAPLIVEGSIAKSLFEITEVFPKTIQAAPGEDVPVTTTITNTGDAEKNETVSVVLDGDVVHEVDLSLAADETVERDIWVTVPETSGEYEYEITAGDSSQRWTASVESTEGELSIESISVPDQINEQTSFEIAVEIENSGNEQRIESMTITANYADSEIELFEDTVTLSASGRTTVSGTLDVPSVDEPTSVVFTVSVGDKTAETDESSLQPQEQSDAGGNGSTNGSADGGSDDASEVTVPGFTIPGTVASLGGAAYVLRKRLGDKDS